MQESLNQRKVNQWVTDLLNSKKDKMLKKP